MKSLGPLLENTPMIAAVPLLEGEQPKSLCGDKILDTAPERKLDDITLLASQICDTSIALISLIDEKRPWFKSRIGMTESEVSIIDNGAGISHENLTRIFSHGFTTKNEGHGFGPHSGAPAAREPGGNLVAFSEGIGRGATLMLELPLREQKSNL
jgi:signal transduction histidine kinase